MKRKREALVHQHLERVSRQLLEKHFEIIRKWIGRNRGVYALYRRGKLYYIGLASSLSSRLRAHLRDRHSKGWDEFSIYLTIKDQHVRELEALLLRITRPTGNAITGKPKGSIDILPFVREEMILKQRKERQQVLGRRGLAEPGKAAKAEIDVVRRLFPKGVKLRATYKGQQFKARLRADGKVRFEGAIFPSLGLAAAAAAGGRKNSWRFWLVERGRGTWVQLREVRRAGTPAIGSGKKRRRLKTQG